VYRSRDAGAGRPPGRAMTRDPALGALLRLYRRHAGLTQRDLAALSGVSEREISDLERNVRQIPRARTLAALATALHLPAAKHARLVRAATRAPQRRAATRAPQRPAATRAPQRPAATRAPQRPAAAESPAVPLLPLIDQALQRALAPLAASLAQQSTTLDRLTLAIATLRAALPPPAPPQRAQHTAPPPPHPLAASQDAHNNRADPVDPVCKPSH